MVLTILFFNEKHNINYGLAFPKPHMKGAQLYTADDNDSDVYSVL